MFGSLVHPLRDVTERIKFSSSVCAKLRGNVQLPAKNQQESSSPGQQTSSNRLQRDVTAAGPSIPRAVYDLLVQDQLRHQPCKQFVTRRSSLLLNTSFGRSVPESWISTSFSAHRSTSVGNTVKGAGPVPQWLADITENNKDPITVADWTGSDIGDVVYQNQASRAYYGDLTDTSGRRAGAKAGGQMHKAGDAAINIAAPNMPSGFLKQLLAHSPEGLDRVLEVLIEDQVSMHVQYLRSTQYCAVLT